MSREFPTKLLFSVNNVCFRDIMSWETPAGKRRWQLRGPVNSGCKRLWWGRRFRLPKLELAGQLCHRRLSDCVTCDFEVDMLQLVGGRQPGICELRSPLGQADEACPTKGSQRPGGVSSGNYRAARVKQAGSVVEGC